MNAIAKMGILAATAGFVMASVVPAEAGRVGGRNGKGTMAAAGSAGGNTWARGRKTTTTDGTTTIGSGGAFKGVNGSTGARAALTTVNPDGSATRTGSAGVSGVRGSAGSQGSATRNADGTYNGSRTTTATNAATGNSYNGSVTYDQNGVKRTATCTDVNGTTIACPR